MSLRVLADPLFPEGVISGLRRAGLDAAHAKEIGAGDLPPREIARLAVFENRVLVTKNRRLARLVEVGLESSLRPSVVFLEQLDAGSAATTHLLLNLLTLFDGDLVEGAMVVVRGGQTLLRRFSPPRR